MSELIKGGLPPVYDPQKIENAVYKFWSENGFFTAAEKSDKPSYCIVLPPPNITGALHMGHALTATIQDLLIRRARMMGYNTLWLPGTDHAGIATQMVVERKLIASGKNRHDLGREKFLEQIWEWKKSFGGRITCQHKRLGASLDWEKERFTMDEGLSKAVREAFVRLYEKEKIFRDKRLINWCVKCRTALSEVEVDRDKPEAGEMWSFAYPLVDGGEIVVATTRPETMLGDTAVVVHPDDDRYKNILGKFVKHPLQDRTFKIIADEILANPELGTGAVKITPAHDPNDFACSKRHNLQIIDILEDDGRLNSNGAPFYGLDRFEARRLVKEKLTDMGLFRGREEHEYAPGRCLRCRTVVEPKLSLQWFVDTDEMAKNAIDAVHKNKTVFIPNHHSHRYFNWLENTVPWCISRQLWWGHQIPAWYCDSCDKITVKRNDPSNCSHCGSNKIRQEEDVLDTWFSSALWPFSTLGWPDDTDLLKTFYPTSVLETGYDIITFWVSRMMMMGLEFMGKVPFHKVLLHPMIRDQDGNKMSKSRGNVIDPMDVIDGITFDKLENKTKSYTLPEKEIDSALKYIKKNYPDGFPRCGTDALRFTMAAYTGQDQDIKFSVEKVEGYSKFGNKIWQAVLGFAMRHLRDMEVTDEKITPETLADKWILARLGWLAKDVNRDIDNFKVGEAANKLYHFFWDELCSWYIELVKPVFGSDADSKIKETSKNVLRHVLDVSLRLMHPFMPFITEVLWNDLPKSSNAPASIMLASYPTIDDGIEDDEAIKKQTSIMDTISAVRKIRSEYDVKPNMKIKTVIKTSNKNLLLTIEENLETIKSLAGIKKLEIDAPEYGRHIHPLLTDCVTAVIDNAEIFLPLSEMIDISAERNRLNGELVKIKKLVEAAEKKLGNNKFIANAPEAIVEKEKTKLTKASEKLQKIESNIKKLGLPSELGDGTGD